MAFHHHFLDKCLYALTVFLAPTTRLQAVNINPEQSGQSQGGLLFRKASHRQAVRERLSTSYSAFGFNAERVFPRQNVDSMFLTLLFSPAARQKAERRKEKRVEISPRSTVPVPCSGQFPKGRVLQQSTVFHRRGVTGQSYFHHPLSHISSS